MSDCSSLSVGEGVSGRVMEGPPISFLGLAPPELRGWAVATHKPKQGYVVWKRVFLFLFTFLKCMGSSHFNV